MDKRPQQGDTFPLTIDGYASDGSGVGRLEGMVVFVPGALRGEVCQVQLTHVGRSALWGRVKTILTPSPARIPPDCPYDAQCGGCRFRHMDYAEELQAKRARVEDALCRIGGASVRVEAVLGAGCPARYRNKAQFPAAPGPKIGFYREHSHQVVDVADCLLQSPAAARLRAAVKDWMRRYRVSAYDERTRKGLVRHVYVRTSRSGAALCCVLVNGKTLPREQELTAALRCAEPGLTGVVLGVNETHSNVILGTDYRTLWGEDFLYDTLCGFTFKLSVPSFYQVNPDQAEVLYDRVLELAGLTGEQTVLDLYCGIGTISLVLARRAKLVYGAEVVRPAIEDAVENARRNGVGNARFLCADAGEAALRLEAEGVRPDVICVDPPRKGLAPAVVDTIVRMAPRRVVYVSCDPGTLARDIARFREQGWSVRRALAVDMFPRTAHVETVVLLSKGEVDSKKIRVEFSLEDMDMSEFQDGATYTQIKDYVLEHSGLKVSNLYISQIKRKCGIEVGKNYNLPKSEDSRQPQCPPEKEKAIREAFKYFGMI